MFQPGISHQGGTHGSIKGRQGCSFSKEPRFQPPESSKFTGVDGKRTEFFFGLDASKKKKDVGLLEKVVFYFSDGRMSCFFGVGIHISLVKILGTI